MVARAPHDRARQLRRTATALLAVMAGLFLLSRHVLSAHPVWPWVLAFAEAAAFPEPAEALADVL